jgi:hypothetical protein
MICLRDVSRIDEPIRRFRCVTRSLGVYLLLYRVEEKRR